METSPTGSDDLALDLAEAEASRATWAGGLTLPSHFHSPIGLAVAVQIATSAIGIADDRPWSRWLLVAGLAVFLAVAATQLVRFRAANGVWVAGLASRVVLGTATPISTAYMLAFGGAVWAAYSQKWWLVGLAAVAGGTADTALGRRWWWAYQADPATHSRTESTAWLVACAGFAVVGLALLLVGG